MFVDKCYPAYGSEKFATANDINLVVSAAQAKDLADILHEAANESVADIKVRISRKPGKSDTRHRIAILFET